MRMPVADKTGQWIWNAEGINLIERNEERSVTMIRIFIECVFRRNTQQSYVYQQSHWH